MMDRTTTYSVPEDGQQAETGAMLRRAREQMELSAEQAAARLKVPSRVVQALESGDWARLGAPVFVRGHLRSYARLLGVTLDEDLDQVASRSMRPVELVSHVHTPRYQRVLESTGRRAVYVVITVCFFAVPMWLLFSNNGAGTRALKTASLDVIPKAAQPRALPALKGASGQSSVEPISSQVFVDNGPITASMAPRITQAPAPSAASTGPALHLALTGDSWVEIEDPEGHMVERGLLKSGDERDFAAGQVGRVKLGNATAVQVQHDGSTVDLSPYRRANVARFEVSSDGSLAPVQD